jgi:dihydroneopterin aldolase
VRLDIVFIHDLKVQTVIGVYEWERRIRQTISLDLDMQADIGRAAVSDSIDDALDYKAVAHDVTAMIESSTFMLVETLAEAVARLLLDQYRIGWVRVRVSKPAAVRGAKAVGVVIERQRGAA